MAPACWALFFPFGCYFLFISPATAHSNNMSRHLLLDDLSRVIVLADAFQTPGPFAEQENDYVRDTDDLTFMGQAGSPGLSSTDRITVTEGVPLRITVGVYDIDGMELPNVEVYLWHTDAAGVYSAVGEGRQELEDTFGQLWCRGVQTTDRTGEVSFTTILPGWYPGRAIHYHLRLKFPGETMFAATTQLYIADDDLENYQTVAPYSDNSSPVRPLNEDGIFNRIVDPRIQDLMTLKLEGSVEEGFTSTVQVGVVPPEGFSFAPTFSPTTATPTITTARPSTNEPTVSPITEPLAKPTDASLAEGAPRPSMPAVEENPPGMDGAIPPTVSPIDILLADATTTTESNAASDATRNRGISLPIISALFAAVMVPRILDIVT